MNVLLDTHAFLWFVDGNPRLSDPARMLIEAVDTQPFVSVASLWEMAIKVSLGKLSLDQPYEELIPLQLTVNSMPMASPGYGETIP